MPLRSIAIFQSQDDSRLVSSEPVASEKPAELTIYKYALRT
ncbi:MAG: hypothetical protein AAF745_15415 [Planctomycetota bacterium]